MSIELPLVDDHLFIDASTLEKYTTCRRSYEYYGLHKRRLAGERPALIFGQALHKALELHYRGADVLDVVQAIHSVFRESGPIPEGDHRTAAFCQDVFLAYTANYPVEPFDVLTDAATGQPLVESPFSLPLGLVTYQGRPIQVVWTGRLDLIVKFRELPAPPFHLDHKTTSIMGEKYFDEYMNEQAQIGYAWATKKMLGLERPEGFMINAICSRPPTKTGKGTEFRRQRFFLDNDRLDEWEENTLEQVQGLVRDAERGVFPMHMKWCVGKYGKCSYFDVCSLPRDERIGFLHSTLYTDVTWSPLNPPSI